MKANKFYSLKSTIGNPQLYHRQMEGGFSKGNSGVYFWGFDIRSQKDHDKDLDITNKDQFVIWYIGKHNGNIAERIMQEVTQLIFGGFGPIIKSSWLISNPHRARLFEKREKNDPDVIYKPDGLHILTHFLEDKGISNELSWMKDRLIFTWINIDDPDIIKKVEREMHHIVRTNCFGIGGMKNLHPKLNYRKADLFNKIDWSLNMPLKEWLMEVNDNI